LGDLAEEHKQMLKAMIEQRLAAMRILLSRRHSAGRARLNAKKKGSRNEYRSMRLLEASGYACTRAAASLSVFDIIGIGATDVVLVQTKSNDWPGSAEVETIRDFVCPPGCKKLIHRWRDRQRNPDVKIVT
jgi:hypothetical protein